MRKCQKSMKKGFDSESIYNEKNLKTKIKFYEGKINTKFLSLIDWWNNQTVFGSVYGTDNKNYYPQLF